MKLLLASLAVAAAVCGQTAFRVQVSGSGQPIILVPGLTASGATWDSTVARYKNRFECHVLTLAGFAGVPYSEPGRSGDLATVREQLATYIRDKKLAKPILIGHSLGGTIIMDFASHFPDIPSKLIIVDEYPFMMGLDPNMTPAQAKSIAGEIRKNMSAMGQDAYAKSAETGAQTNNMTTSPENQKVLIEWARTSDLRAVAGALADMLGGDWRDGLVNIKSPTMVLAAWKGSEDQGANHEVVDKNMHAQYANLKGVEIHVTDNSRHFIMWDDPSWMFGHLDRFLTAK